MASSRRGAVVDYLSLGPNDTRFVDTASVEELASGAIKVYQEKTRKGGDVTWFSVGAYPESAKNWKFHLAWLEAHGRLRTTQTVKTDDGSLAWEAPPTTLVRFPTDTFQFSGPIAASGPWVMSHAYDGDLTEVQLALPN